MVEIVNLRRERKRRTRDRAAEQAAEMRARHGRNRAEWDAQAREEARVGGALDGARLDPTVGPKPSV